MPTSGRLTFVALKGRNISDDEEVPLGKLVIVFSYCDGCQNSLILSMLKFFVASIGEKEFKIASTQG